MKNATLEILPSPQERPISLFSVAASQGINYHFDAGGL